MTVSAQETAEQIFFRAVRLIKDENFIESDHWLIRLWERFSTAMNMVGPLAKIMAKSRSHQPLASAKKLHRI